MPGSAEFQHVLELRPGDGIHEATANRSPLVAFNVSGTRLPLVCVRTWRYDVDNYRNLARALGPDQPIYTASPPRGETEADFPRDTEAWAKHFSRILGPILDGYMRNTAEGLRFVETAAAKGVSGAVAERDAPFGDYSQAPPAGRPDPAHLIEARPRRGRKT
jgi:hypothetical protein